MKFDVELNCDNNYCILLLLIRPQKVTDNSLLQNLYNKLILLINYHGFIMFNSIHEYISNSTD